MPEQQANRPRKHAGRWVISLFILVLAAAGLWMWSARQPPGGAAPDAHRSAVPPAATADAQKVVSMRPPTVIGEDALAAQPQLRELMSERKARFGIDKGVDFIAAPDEAIEVGGVTVPMSEILDKIRLKRGDIIEKNLDGRRTPEEILAELDRLEPQMADAGRRAAAGDPAARAEVDDLTTRRARLERELSTVVAGSQADGQVTLYGIYVVRKNDNIWNIHFNFLKDLFNHKGIALSPRADEPSLSGKSSGVGKLLKFSENMVAIYNVREHRLETDLNLITPDSKIVVFNFSRVFAMLDEIDYSNIDQIQFDGETIWIPAQP
jgi:hypothetical protein